VVPEQKNEIYLTRGRITSKPPSVKYRGIFINDEDWGLQPWAAKTFEPETQDIGPKTYARVFELLLRLKANLIWPAMHESTKAFFHYPGNAKVAADYSVIIGSSHAEPMLRNNVGEWNEKSMGHFNYISKRKGFINTGKTG
jgi:Glycosyl hydrolase family 115